MNESERIARLITKALHADLSPDDVVLRFQTPTMHAPWAMSPMVVLPAVLVPTMPLWRHYEPAAEAIIADEERRREHHSV